MSTFRTQDRLRDLGDWDADWQRKGLEIGGNLYVELSKCGMKNAACYDVLSDLNGGDLLQEFEMLAGRTPVSGNMRVFKELIKASEQFAGAKRRMICKALAEPWLREVAPPPPIFTTRELLMSARVVRAVADYPVAGQRKLETKDEVRQRWARKISQIIIHCDFPAAQFLQTSIAPERYMDKLSGGKRGSTLAQKVRSFYKLRDWMNAAFSKDFPTREVEVMDYLLDLADQPCGPSVPKSTVGTISFFEELGNVKAASRVGRSSVVTALVNELKLCLTSDKPKPKKKANQYLVCLMGSWEVMVSDRSLYDVARVRVWTKLVKVWAAFRTADLGGIPPSSMTLENGILRGKMLVTKTTGTGKSVAELSFNISDKAWIKVPDWLTIGWNLFSKFTTARSYFLPLISKDHQTFSVKEPSFQQWVTSDRKLLSETCLMEVVVDGEDEGFGMEEITSGIVPYLLPGMQMFWGGHSDRCTIVSWAAALDISKSERNVIGRWRPSESDEYVRTSLAIVLRVQEKVATSIRQADEMSRNMEDDLYRDFSVFCINRGFSEEEVMGTLERIKRGRAICGMCPPEPCPNHPADPITLDDDDTSDFDEAEPPGGWPKLSKGKRVVSISNKGTCRTLHVVGKCWRIPGIHFAKFAFLDDEEVGEFHAVCKDCFPRDSLTEALEESEEDSDSSVSSDSSSSAD